MYDLIVVGTGFCGSVIANKAAQDGKRVLMLEKRDHIAGNMYDYRDDNGLIVQKYGPHVFHTSNKEVADYLRAIDDWEDFEFTYAVDIDGEDILAPFGFGTIDRLYDEEHAEALKRKLLNYYGGQEGVVILDLLECLDEDVQEFAKYLYEKNYLPYALKQWRLPPEELSNEIIGRMPVRISTKERYFQDDYEMLPRDGFTSLFQKMLSSPLIDVRLNADALDYLSIKNGDNLLYDGSPVNVPVVYTGPLENLLLGKTGFLPYRSLKIDFETLPMLSYHDYVSVTYPARYDYLRTTDFSKFIASSTDGTTTVSFEYPTPYEPNSSTAGAEPYYPILTPESIERNHALQEMAANIEYLYPCGRLADFHYYNMDKAIERAFEVYQELYSAFWRE